MSKYIEFNKMYIFMSIIYVYIYIYIVSGRRSRVGVLDQKLKIIHGYSLLVFYFLLLIVFLCCNLLIIYVYVFKKYLI